MWRPHAWWSAVRLKLRRGEQPPYLSDDAGFDYPEEVAAEDELPRFNKLRVLVADDAPTVNGGPRTGSSDDDSLLERDTPQPRAEPCEGCHQEREKRRQRMVKRRLGLAAVLYLLFMVAELIGE